MTAMTLDSESDYARVAEERLKLAHRMLRTLHILTLSPEHEAVLRRATTVVVHARARIAALDPDLALRGALQSISMTADSLAHVATEIRTAPVQSWFDNLENNADSILESLYRLPPLPPQAEMTRLATRANEVRQEFEGRMAGVDDALARNARLAEEIGSRLEALQRDQIAREARLDEAINRQQLAFDEAQTQRGKDSQEAEAKRVREWSESQLARDGAVAAAIAAMQTESEGTMRELRELSAELLNTSRNDWVTTRKGFEDAHKKSLDETTAQTTSKLEEMEKKRAEAEKLVGIIVETGMVSGFQRTANKEADAAFWWSLGTVASLLTLAGVAIWMVYPLISPSATLPAFRWDALVGKLSVTLALALLALYCSREALHHRAAERENRRDELRLASLPPYLSRLPESEQTAIHRQFAERFFTQQPAPVMGKASLQPLPKEVIDQLIKLVEVAKK